MNLGFLNQLGLGVFGGQTTGLQIGALGNALLTDPIVFQQAVGDQTDPDLVREEPCLGEVLIALEIELSKHGVDREMFLRRVWLKKNLLQR